MFLKKYKRLIKPTARVLCICLLRCSLTSNNTADFEGLSQNVYKNENTDLRPVFVTLTGTFEQFEQQFEQRRRPQTKNPEPKLIKILRETFSKASVLNNISSTL